MNPSHRAPRPDQAAAAPLLSAIVVVKDELRNLPRVMDSAKDVVDEWIVVDTGSNYPIRTLAILERYEPIPALARALGKRLSPLPPDVCVLGAEAELRQGRTLVAARVLADGLASFPEHPDLYHELLATAAVGYAGSTLRLLQTGDPFEGLVTSLPQAGRLIEGLAELEILHPGAAERLPEASRSKANSAPKGCRSRSRPGPTDLPTPRPCPCA